MSPSGDEGRDGEDPPRWYCGSRVQKPPLPGSSFERATLMKHLLSDRLWRMEFCNQRYKKGLRPILRTEQCRFILVAIF